MHKNFTNKMHDNKSQPRFKSPRSNCFIYIGAEEEGLRFQRLSIFENGGKNPSFFRIKNRGLSPRSKFFIHILVPKRGLEPLRIAPYAPETHVSTIPPLRHNLILPNYIQFSKFSYALSGGCWFKTNPLGKPDV